MLTLLQFLCLSLLSSFKATYYIIYIIPYFAAAPGLQRRISGVLRPAWPRGVRDCLAKLSDGTDRSGLEPEHGHERVSKGILRRL